MIGGEFMCSGKVLSFCSSRVTLVANPVISYESVKKTG
jgi:hypothetical protein